AILRACAGKVWSRLVRGVLAYRVPDFLDRPLDLGVAEVAAVGLAEIAELGADAVEREGLRRDLAPRMGARARPGHRDDREVVAIGAGTKLREIEELGHRLHDVVVPDEARDQELARQRAPQAVAAQDQGVVAAQRRGRGHLDLGTRGGAHAVEYLVAVRV